MQTGRLIDLWTTLFITANVGPIKSCELWSESRKHWWVHLA